MSAIVTAEYKTFLKEITERIYKAQYDAIKAVNKELINLYWDIGRSTVAKQDALGGQGYCGDPAKRSAKRVSWDTGVLRKKSLEYANILPELQR